MEKKKKLDLLLYYYTQNDKVLILWYSVLVKPFWSSMFSQHQTDKLEDISWKESRLMSGLENIKSEATIKNEDIEPGKKPGRGKIYEVEKPSCGKAISMSIWLKSRKKINV